MKFIILEVLFEKNNNWKKEKKPRKVNKHWEGLTNFDKSLLSHIIDERFVAAKYLWSVLLGTPSVKQIRKLNS